MHRKAGRGRTEAEESTAEAEAVLALEELVGRFLTYGDQRLKVLVSRQLGRPVNAKPIRRLMREHGLVTANRTERARPVPHTGEVEASGPHHVWQMDFTRVLVGSRWYCLLVVMDRFSREVVGWELSRRARAGEWSRYGFHGFLKRSRGS